MTNFKLTKFSVPNIDFNDLVEINEQIEEAGKEIKINKLRVVFEAIYQNQLNLTTSDSWKRVYENPTTEAIYRGWLFSVAQHEKAIRRSFSRIKKASVTGPFLVGAYDGQRATLGQRPKLHRTLTVATQEADRLHASYEKKFLVFGGVYETEEEMIDKTSPTVAETNEDTVRNYQAGRTLTGLQEIVKQKLDTSQFDWQSIQIQFSATGSFLVDYYKPSVGHEVREVFENQQEMINFIGDKVKQVFKYEREQKRLLSTVTTENTTEE